MAHRKKRAPAPTTTTASKSAVRRVVTATGEPSIASQPSVRASVLWTPTRVKTLSLQADGGDLFMLGDLCDQMLADDRIGELLETLAGEVLGADLSFEKSARSKVGDAEKSAELTEDWPKSYDDDELTSLIMWTLMTGVGFAKHERWIQAEPDVATSRILPVLKWWHPKQFVYAQHGVNTWDRSWMVRDQLGQRNPIAPGDGTWVILTRRGEYRPWANGFWRGLAPWWMLKQYAIQDWGIHSEKASRLVVYQDESSMGSDRSEDRRILAEEIRNASTNAVIALPEGFRMELIELSANTREIYDAQIKAAEEGFAIAILGQNLTTNVQGGSRSAAEVHERKESKKVKYAAQMLSKGLQQQSIAWWAEFNFGDRDLAPYPRYHTEPDEDYLAKATSLKMLGDGLLVLRTAGYKLKTEQLEDEYGVALEEAEPLVPPTAAGQQQPGKAAPAKAPAKQPGKPAPKAMLASGDAPGSAPGFIRGQVYTDALTDKETALAADYLSGFVDRVAAAVEDADDYEAVRAAVIKAFGAEEDPDRLVELIEHGILLANLAGRHAVDEDAEAAVIAEDGE